MNDIERILKSVKVDDSHILLGESHKEVMYGKEIEIKQVNFWHTWDKFAYYMGVFLQVYSAVGDAFQLPDRHTDLEQFRKNIRITLANTAYGKQAIKIIIKMVKLCQRISARWMKKNFTLDDWTNIFLWIYIYNIFGVKKNLLNASKVLAKLSS